MSHSSVKSDGIPVIVMSANNSKSLTSIRKTKIYMGNQWKSTAKNYPRIQPAGNAFGRPPFCMSIDISSQTTPYVVTAVAIGSSSSSICNYIFNIQCKKCSHEGQICRCHFAKLQFIFLEYLHRMLQFIPFYDNFLLSILDKEVLFKQKCYDARWQMDIQNSRHFSAEN